MANQAVSRSRSLLRRSLRRSRRTVAAMLAPVAGVAAQLAPAAAAAVAGAAVITAASVALSDQPAHASVAGESVLILSTSVSNGTSSLEAQEATNLGMTVTVATPATWDSYTLPSQFQQYNLIVIGDPSTTSCASTVPSDALSTAGIWGPAVTGNVALLGTAPALASASTLVYDALNYAASGGSSETGLYVSLNCEYSAASANAPVTLLGHVDGGGFTVTGQGAYCPSDAGTVNTWQALALQPFNGLTSGQLGPWSAPACSVEETFNSWPAGLNGVGYYSGAGASPATFTASDGTTGQAYILAGAPVSSATAKLAPSVGGQVMRAAAVTGSNPAAPGVSQAVAASTNTATGSFTQSNTDLSVPTFGPSLSFTRSYDAQTAQAQTSTGTPGPMGYGWSANWTSTLQTGRPVPGDIYTVDGLRTDNGDGGSPLQAPFDHAGQIFQHGADTYIVDSADNRIQEIPGSTGVQWGISMTAGDVYTVAGSPSGQEGDSPNGTPAGQSLLSTPGGVVVTSNGMYIADSANNRVVEIPSAAGQNRGFGTMTVNDMYVIAGIGTAGYAGDGGAAYQAQLSWPVGLGQGAGNSDIYIADSGNNRVQEIPASTGSQWGQSMTAYDMYTVAGSATGVSGDNGANGPATSALLNSPEGVGISGSGDLYIAVTGNNKIQEVAKANGTQWLQSMTANDLYNITSRTGTAGYTGDGGNVGAALLDAPVSVALNNGQQVYVADMFKQPDPGDRPDYPLRVGNLHVGERHLHHRRIGHRRRGIYRRRRAGHVSDPLPAGRRERDIDLAGGGLLEPAGQAGQQHRRHHRIRRHWRHAWRRWRSGSRAHGRCQQPGGRGHRRSRRPLHRGFVKQPRAGDSDVDPYPVRHQHDRR